MPTDTLKEMMIAAGVGVAFMPTAAPTAVVATQPMKIPIDPEPPDGFRRLKPLEYLLFIHNDANLTEQRYDFNRYFQ